MNVRNRRTAIVTVALALTLVLAGCPLPFEFSPSETNGSVAGSNDPANPSVTAPATLVVAQTTTGNPVATEPDVITSNRNLTVSFESETRGAAIFYTVDGSDPIPGEPATRRFDPEAPIEFTGHASGATVRTIALGPSMYPSIITERLVSVVWDRAEAPAFTPGAGNYSTNQSIEITTTTAGATIYYTIADGTGGAPTPVPGEPGTIEYSGPVAVEGTGTAKSISAVAVRSEMLTSPVSSAVFSIGFEPAVSPSFSLSEGTYASDQSVSISTPEPDGTVYYTLSTTASAPPTPVPGAAGTFEYTGPIPVSGNGTVRSITAIAVAPQKLNSPPVSGTWSVSYPNAGSPTFTPTSDTYTSDQSVQIGTTTSNATIYYTQVSGSGPAPDPVPGQPGTNTYSGPIPVSGHGTQTSIAAIAVSPSTSQSAVSRATFTISYPDAAPATFSPGGTTFISPTLTVTLSSTTVSAMIWYTTDGSAPSAGGGGTTQSGPSGTDVTISATTTVRAVVTAPGHLTSPASSATYTQSSYATLSRADIVALEPQMSGNSIDNRDGNRIPVGQVIVYRTGDGNYGKLYVLVSDGSNNNGLTFDHITYAADGSILASGPAGAGTIVSGTWGFDLDLQGAQQGDGVLDFRLVNQTSTERWLDPQDTAVFYMVP